MRKELGGILGDENETKEENETIIIITQVWDDKNLLEYVPWEEQRGKSHKGKEKEFS